jgi:hypothetical protein
MQVIKETSALTFMIAGTVKEVVTGERHCWGTTWVLGAGVRGAVLLLHSTAQWMLPLCMQAARTAWLHLLPGWMPPAVLAAVSIMGDKLTPVNSVGLCIVIVGVLLFNRYKYHRMKQVAHRAWLASPCCRHLHGAACWGRARPCMHAQRIAYRPSSKARQCAIGGVLAGARPVQASQCQRPAGRAFDQAPHAHGSCSSSSLRGHTAPQCQRGSKGCCLHA